MKKILLSIAAIVLLSLTMHAQPCKVLQSDFSDIRIAFSTGNVTVKEVNLNNRLFNTVAIDGFSAQPEAGMPALPSLTKLIEIPLGEGLNYTVLSITADTIEGSQLGITLPIVPAQPSRSKSDTSAMSLILNQAAYSTSDFLGEETILLQGIGVARNRNLARVVFNPVRWNPVTNQLIIVKDITISIKQRNADIEATRHMQILHASPAFNSSFDVINNIGTKDNHTNAPLRYTIVAYSGFRGALDDFAAWKRRKGFIVDLVYTDDANVGSTTQSIQAYLQGLYDNATAESPAPTYVLFVGDVAQLPAFYLSAYNEQHYSDLSYCCWTGNDNIPDCYYGRFSAQNLSQLTPQISKTLMYEQYTFPDDQYLSKAALIAGVDRGYSGDNAYTYADPTMDYIAKTYITSSNNFTNIVYYKNNTSFAPTGVTVTGSSSPTSTATALKNLYNSGCGWVNYSAHGDNTLWYQPSFTTSDVAVMSNNNKPMVMIGNCCLTNSFQVDACLGEALLRKGNNAGAVGYIGASNSTYWTEDFYWSVGVRSNISNTCNPNYDANHMGMYDHLFHSHGESFDNWYTTMGGMIYIGNMSVEGSSTQSDMKLYYWQIYHLMGDPSLMPYFHGTASEMEPDVPPTLFLGGSEMTLSNLPPYAYIAFNSPENTLLTAAFADANGDATLTFEDLSAPGEYELVITAQGYKPYITSIYVNTTGPFVKVASFTPNSDIIAGQDVSFDVTLKNIGLDNASNITIEFQSIDGNVLFSTSGQTNVGTSLAPDQELNIDDVCNAHFWGHIDDQSETLIKAIVRWDNAGETIFTKTYRFTVNADLVKIQSYELDNHFEESETATLTVRSMNVGHATLINGEITLLSLEPTIEILNPTNNISNVAVNDQLSFNYNIVLHGDVPENRQIPVLQLVNNGFNTTVDTILLTYGVVSHFITFEDNSWGDYEWINSEYPWELTNQGAYAGSWCARSKNYGNNGVGNSNSDLIIHWTSTVDDSISFYKKVSSESNYDFFRFYIDGQEAEQLSGTDNEWSRSAYAISAGTHSFKFSYEKDGSVNRGSDCAWIDNIKLPFSGELRQYLIDSICEGDIYMFGDTEINTNEIGSGIYQYVDSTENGIIYLTLMVNAKPEVTINVEGNTTISAGESVRLTLSGADSYQWSTGEVSSVLDVYPTETTTYTVIGMNGNCLDTASVTITVNYNGIGEVLSANDVHLYPNPAQQYVIIEGENISKITFSDITGRTVKSISAVTVNKIDISQFNNGVYFVQIIDNKGNLIVKKFVKK